MSVWRSGWATGGFGQAVRAHHGQCTSTNRFPDMPALAHGAAETAQFGFSRRDSRLVPGEKFHEIFATANPDDAGPPPPVRNAKRLVQVQMTNVRANVRWTAQARLARFMGFALSTI